MKHKLYSEIVTAEDNGIRLDRWFKRRHSGLSFAWVAKNTRKGLIRVNSKKIDISDKIAQGDTITYPEFAAVEATPKDWVNTLKPSAKIIQTLQNSVIYKDDDIIVLNKPSGLAVQGGTKINDSVDSLAEFLKFDYDEKPKLVHRLDKDTSGILVLARKTSVAALFNRIFHSKDLKKTYIAIVNGVPKPREGVIDVPLEKLKENEFEKMTESDKGKKTITHYKVLDHAASTYALVELRLITGRTHQLRAHMAFLSCPIMGDSKYGEKITSNTLVQNKLYLHAHKMEFVLKDKHHNFTAPIPQHFKQVLDNLGLDF